MKQQIMTSQSKKYYIIFAAIALLLLLGCGYWLWSKSTYATCERGKKFLEMGQNELDNDNNIDALINLQHAYRLAEKCQDQENRFAAGVYIAVIYNMTGQSERAYELLKSLQYVESKRKRYYASQYYYRLLAYFLATYDHAYEASAEAAKKVIELDKKLHPNEITVVYADMANLGELYLMGKNYNKAWEIVQQVKDVPPAGNLLYLSQLDYVHSSLLFVDGKYDEAYKVANEGLEYARQYKMASLELLNLGVLCKIDSARKDFKSYMVNKQAHERLSDEMHDNEINSRIKAMDMQNQMEMKRTKAEVNTRWLYIVAGMGLLTVIALCIAFLYFRRYKQAKHLISVVERQSIRNHIECNHLKKELNRLHQEHEEEPVS